jgi:arylsulfatase A-like enzyme
MNEEIFKLADLSNVKKGDTIWTYTNGDVLVMDIIEYSKYPIRLKDKASYTLSGKWQLGDKYPTAFTKKPFENIGFQERWMMVSMNGGDWSKRKVFAKKDGKFLSWSGANTDEDVKKAIGTTAWEHAKEIEEPKELELTLEEIAEKFGVSVELIKIKK